MQPVIETINIKEEQAEQTQKGDTKLQIDEQNAEESTKNADISFGINETNLNVSTLDKSIINYRPVQPEDFNSNRKLINNNLNTLNDNQLSVNNSSEEEINSDQDLLYDKVYGHNIYDPRPKKTGNCYSFMNFYGYPKVIIGPFCK